MKKIFLSIYLIYQFFIISSENQKCMAFGETSLLLYSTTKIKISCEEPFTVLSFGFINDDDTEIDLVDLRPNYVEKRTFYNRFFFDFSDNVVTLGDVDENINKFNFYFSVELHSDTDELVITNPFRILFEKHDPMDASERIKYGRVLTDLYTLKFDETNIINYKIYEERYNLKFTEILLCPNLNEECDHALTPLNHVVTFEFEDNIFLFTNDHIQIVEFGSTIKYVSLGVVYKQNGKEKMISFRKFTFEVPVEIIKITPDLIKWDIKIFSSFVNIYYIHTIMIYKVYLGRCEKINNQIACNRNSSLTSHFGKLNELGIELKNREVTDYLFEIEFDAVYGTMNNRYFENLVINIKNESKTIDYYETKVELFRDAVIFVSKVFLPDYGILNASLANYPKLSLNWGRYSGFDMIFEKYHFNLCANTGIFIEEFFNSFTSYILECKNFYITFYNVDKDRFTGKRLRFFFKGSVKTRINVNSDPFRFDHDFSLPKDQNLVNYHRYLNFEPVLFANQLNEIDFEIPEGIFEIVSVGIIKDEYDAEIHLFYDKTEQIDCDNFLIRVEGSKIHLSGNVVEYGSIRFVLGITDGIRSLFQVTKPAFVDYDVVLPKSCYGGNISWELTIQTYSFELCLLIGNKLFKLGYCAFNTPCSIHENPYVNEMSHRWLKLIDPTKPQEFTLYFLITPIISDDKLQLIEFQEKYDLNGPLCDPSKKSPYTVPSNVRGSSSDDDLDREPSNDEEEENVIEEIFLGAAIGIFFALLTIVLFYVFKRIIYGFKKTRHLKLTFDVEKSEVFKAV